ncbi:cytochrome P450-like protein [Crucibulum laeve]|uniref:Cytochrome P450-like protein n=1 Tax=Crucibulum laeve TaxID=68775 RepID=A0A5C3LEL7_9AGAR|nr:cytochrome P450-like protein [Crucibulum laeve]
MSNIQCVIFVWINAGFNFTSGTSAIFYDKDSYPNPEIFNPGRFFDGNNQPDPRNHVFGYGRRLCPGRHLAEASLWLSMASILSTFDILPHVDEHGRPHLPVIDYTSGVMSSPTTFSCRFQPRSNATAEIIG